MVIIAKVNLVFYAHQAKPLNDYAFVDIGNSQQYFNEELCRQQTQRNAHASYLPTNKAILSALDDLKDNESISIALSSNTVEQLENHAPQALDSFKQIMTQSNVNVLAMPMANSIMITPRHYESMVQMHQKLMQSFCNKTPSCIIDINGEDTKKLHECATNLACTHIISTNQQASTGNNLQIVHEGLSSDINKKFADTSWEHYPLNAKTFASWVSGCEQDVITIAINYATCGIHAWEETGIFNFIASLPQALHEEGHTLEPNQESKDTPKHGKSNVGLANKMQQHALTEVAKLRTVSAKNNTLNIWQNLTQADIFANMHTDQKNAHQSSYDAYIAMMNIMQDIKQRT